jgi:hypothetical protein
MKTKFESISPNQKRVNKPRFIMDQDSMVNTIGVYEINPSNLQPSWISEPGESKLYEGIEQYKEKVNRKNVIIDPQFYRKQFLNFLFKKNNDLVPASRVDFRNQSIIQNDPKKASITLESLFNDKISINGKDIKGTELYLLALKEERYSTEYMNAVAAKCTQTFIGKKLEKPLHVVVGGGSGLGKTFAAEALFREEISSDLGEKNKNDAVFIDNGISRSVSQVEQWAMGYALDSGYTGITNTAGFKAFKEVKKCVLAAAKEASPNAAVSIVELGTVDAHKKLEKVCKSKNRQPMFAYVEATHMPAKELASRQGNSRAYLNEKTALGYLKDPLASVGDISLPEGKEWEGANLLGGIAFFKAQSSVGDVKAICRNKNIPCRAVINDRLLFKRDSETWSPCKEKDLKKGDSFVLCSNRIYEQWKKDLTGLELDVYSKIKNNQPPPLIIAQKQPISERIGNHNQFIANSSVKNGSEQSNKATFKDRLHAAVDQKSGLTKQPLKNSEPVVTATVDLYQGKIMQIEKDIAQVQERLKSTMERITKGSTSDEIDDEEINSLNSVLATNSHLLVSLQKEKLSLKNELEGFIKDPQDSDKHAMLEGKSPSVNI